MDNDRFQYEKWTEKEKKRRNMIQERGMRVLKRRVDIYRKSVRIYI